ncbi:hypothetical protein HDV06_003655 [Boothiomyces sp. JEL0866]|nr:hypothetical protein HDV06_003655 [Boothiomyces sp. JEL0866]
MTNLSVNTNVPNYPSFKSSKRRIIYNDFSTIDWTLDSQKERERQQEIGKLTGYSGFLIKLFEMCQESFIIILVGSITGLFAGFIDITEGWLSNMREGYCTEGFYLNKKFCCWLQDECTDWIEYNDSTFLGTIFGFLVYCILGLLFATASAILVKEYAKYAAGSGIPEVKTILGGFIIHRFLGFRTLIVKCLGLVLSVASGLSVGKEGPSVHLACCIANITSRLVPKYKGNQANRRELMSAACAAGVSVAFGAPIGGVLFSLEEVSYYFPHKTMWKSFFMAMIAAITLQIINPFRTHKLVLFQVELNRDWYGFELPIFILLGVLGGLYGVLFIKMNLKVIRYRRTSWISNHPIAEVGVIALATAMISYQFNFLSGGTAELVANLFRECKEIDGDFHGLCSNNSAQNVFLLFVVAFVKAVFTIFTFGIKVPAGIFIPSMAVGATVGRAIGLIIQELYNAFPNLWIFASCSGGECVTPGTYAIIGAAAALGGVTRMTVSLVVIMFELTGALSYVLPIMMTVVIAKWIGDTYGEESIYDALIHLNGYPFLSSELKRGKAASAADLMTSVEDLVCIQSEGQTIQSLDTIYRENRYKGFPVVTADNLIIGYFGRAELLSSIQTFTQSTQTQSNAIHFQPSFSLFDDSIDFQSWMDTTPMMVHPQMMQETVQELFIKMGLRYVLVARNGVLKGIITKKDLLRHFN